MEEGHPANGHVSRLWWHKASGLVSAIPGKAGQESGGHKPGIMLHSSLHALLQIKVTTKDLHVSGLSSVKHVRNPAARARHPHGSPCLSHVWLRQRSFVRFWYFHKQSLDHPRILASQFPTDRHHGWGRSQPPKLRSARLFFL